MTRSTNLETNIKVQTPEAKHARASVGLRFSRLHHFSACVGSDHDHHADQPSLVGIPIPTAQHALRGAAF